MGLDNLFTRTAATIGNLAQRVSRVEKHATKRAPTKKRSGIVKTSLSEGTATSQGTSPTKETDIPQETAPLQESSYTRVKLEDGDFDETLNTAIPVERKKEISCQVPNTFLKPHLPVTGTTDMPMNWKFYAALCDSPLHNVKTQDGRYPAWKLICPETNFNKLGLLKEFQRKQELELSPGFNERRARHLQATLRGRSHFEMGFSTSTGGGAFSVGPSPNSRGGPVNSGCETEPEVIEWLNLSTKIANAALEYAIPGHTKEMLRRHNIIDASMNRGLVDTPQKTFISSLQFNSSPIEDNKLASIGKFGVIHIDPGDDQFSWNAFSCTSYLPDNYYCGNMIFPALKIACALVPGTTIIFSGRMPHFSRGLGEYDVPETSPLRHNPEVQIPRPNHGRYRRNGNPGYAKKSLTRSRYLPKDEVLSKGAIESHWGTRENLRTWEMELYIRENAYLNTDENWKKLNAGGTKGGKINPKIFEKNGDGEEIQLKLQLPETFEEFDPTEVVKLFSWVDDKTGETCFPSVETAKIAIQGHLEEDPEWEAARKITSACFFGFAPSKKVTDERKETEKAFKKEHEKETAPILAEFNDKLDEYKEHEGMGVVIPVPAYFNDTSKKKLGSNTLQRGKLNESTRNRLNNNAASREERHQANRAEALGKALNEMEKKERTEHFVFPPRKVYDNAEYIDVEELEMKLVDLGI